MTPAELDRWERDYMRDLNHKIALWKIRRDSEEWIRNFRARTAALRRQEEAISLLCIQSRVRLVRGRKPLPIALAQHWHDVTIELSGVTPSDEESLLPIWKHDIEQSARDLKVTIRLDATPMNAYAWSTLREIETAPIVTSTSYVIARHELGHNAHPCQPTHIRVTTDAKLNRTACVACELAAWRWAIAGAKPTWTRRMHNCLSRSLLTYRPYATAAEQSEIDQMASPLGFRAAQLAQIRRTIQ